jgi:serine/threonine-protein kinase
MVSGEHVGSYRILETISAGGMGTVYRAEHTLIGKIAAVKILHPELSSNRDIVNRFFNEAKATTSIKHPGIVEVFDFGYMASGHAYLIMEFLDGMPLSQRMRMRGAISEGEAALILRGVCIALAAAHAKGVVHRDLKPDNIFVVPDAESALGERTKILDFGIAKLTDLGLAPGGATRTGAVMGTPTYMSPEQCRGSGDVDFRADLYSIGCILFELVTGRPPFTEVGAGELIAAHLVMTPESPSRFVAGLSLETESLIMTLLAKRPEQRVQSANELAQHLTVIAQRHGWLTPGNAGRSAQLPRLAGPHARTEAIVLPPGFGTGPATPPPGFAPGSPGAATGTAGPGASAANTPIGSAVVTPARRTTALPSIPPKPTTLSGTASQFASLPPPVRRSRTVSLGLALAGALVLGGTAFVVLTPSGGSTHAAGSVAAPPAPPSPLPSADQPAASPNAASPNAASPSAASPNAASPNAASPNAASPNAASPNAASPNTASPNAASPDPSAAQPSTTSPATAPAPATAPDASLPSAPRRSAAPVDPTPAAPSSRPAGTTPASAEPAAAPHVARPQRHKPNDKPSKPPVRGGDHQGSGSASKDMLEQDI